MFVVIIFVSSGRFRPCYLQLLYHVPPTLCGFRRSWRNPAAVSPLAARLSWLRCRRRLALLQRRQIPVLSVFPRRCPAPPQKLLRTRPGTPAQPPHHPDQMLPHPSLCSLRAQSRTPPPTPRQCSDRPPAPHQ